MQLNKIQYLLYHRSKVHQQFLYIYGYTKITLMRVPAKRSIFLYCMIIMQGYLFSVLFLKFDVDM